MVRRKSGDANGSVLAEKKELAVYGTLREGFYNFEKFGVGSIKRIGGGVVEGVDLYCDRGTAYPQACKGSSSVVVDIVETDPKTYEKIAEMEIEAGYVEGIAIVGGKRYPIFLGREVPKPPWRKVGQTGGEAIDWMDVARRLFRPGERGMPRQ